MSNRRPVSLPDRQTTERVVMEMRDQADRDALADVVIDGSRRILLRAPNGNYFSVSIDNSGSLTTTNIGSTPP